MKMTTCACLLFVLLMNVVCAEDRSGEKSHPIPIMYSTLLEKVASDRVCDVGTFMKAIYFGSKCELLSANINVWLKLRFPAVTGNAYAEKDILDALFYYDVRTEQSFFSYVYENKQLLEKLTDQERFWFFALLLRSTNRLYERWLPDALPQNTIAVQFGDKGVVAGSSFFKPVPGNLPPAGGDPAVLTFAPNELPSLIGLYLARMRELNNKMKSVIRQATQND